jgi:tungstate transport system substrate-binding protein
MRRVVSGLVLVLGVLAAHPTEGQRSVVILATTTSTQDSGLLDVLVPLFEKKSGYTVKTIAVGTGQSLAMAVRGDADVVLVHAPTLERKYLQEGALINRRLVMHNDFVIVGPAGDPAGCKGLAAAVKAMRQIAEAKATFVSRGDNSGTHTVERDLWREAGVTPAGPWYLQSGQGMGATLRIASEKRAYTVTDRGTFLALKKNVQLDIVVERDPLLLNVYSVLEANPARHPRVNHAGARAFADFLVSPEAQAVIKTFGVEKYGEPLFFPDAGKQEEQIGRAGHGAKWS